jgi:hypothetical protein
MMKGKADTSAYRLNIGGHGRQSSSLLLARSKNEASEEAAASRYSSIP